MSTEITIVRHGETDWNRMGRLQGHLQIGLNQRGQEQAEAVAECLAEERFDAIFSSDLQRALDTAEAIAARNQHRVIPDARLREWHLGILTGLTLHKAELLHPRAYAIYRDNIPDPPIPQGESLRQRHQRVTEAMSEFAQRHAGGRVLVVTHGGPLDDCYRRATAMPLQGPRDSRLYNGGINRIIIEGDRWRLATWGEIAHLQRIGTLGTWEPSSGS